MGSERRRQNIEKSGPAIAPTITVDRMVQDGIELTEYLRKHLGKEKIIIVAHSFGSILGLRVAISDSAEGQMLSADRLVPQTKSIGPADLSLEFSIPIFVFQGEQGFTTPTALAQQYLESIKAPRKAFVPINGGGHFAVFMRSDQFLQELVARVRPLTVGH